MSRTAEEIGLIVGGLALGGVGALAYYGYLSFGISATTYASMLGMGVSAAASGVGQLLQQQTKLVATNGNIAFQDGVSPRRVIYGQYQTAGVLTYASFPNSQNLSTTSQYLHLVYTLTGHEISSFDAVVVDGTVYNFGSDILEDSSLPNTPWQIHPEASGSNNDFYWQHMMFEFDGGKPQNIDQPFPNLAAADLSWTSACRQQGCAKVHVILRADSGWTAVFPSGQIPNIQFLVTGKKIIDPRIVTAWQASTSYAKYSYTVDEQGVLWYQSASTGTSGSSRPNFEASNSFGSTLSDGGCTWFSTGNFLNSIYYFNDFFGPPTLSGSRLLNDGWAANTTGGYPSDGFVMEAPLGYLQLLTTAGTSGSTRPNFSTTLGATTSDNTNTWTCLGRSTRAINPSNSALCTYDYLQDSDAGMGTSAASIDTASVIAAANICEEQALIIWNADNTFVYENLYRCDGMFDHSSTRGAVLTSLCGSMAGWVIPPGDFWHIFAGAYYSPTVSLGDGDLRAPIKGDFRLSRRDVANGIKGTYIPAFLPTNPAGAMSLNQIPGTWKSQSFPPYQANGLAGKPDYLNSEDNGQIIWQDVHFDFVTSLWQAQRLAKIALMRLRFQESLTLPFKLTAFQLEGGDTFYFTHSRWDILSGVYEASTCSITFDHDPSSVPIIGVDIVGRQTDPSIYSFQGPTSSTDFGEYSPFGVTGVMTGVE